MIAAANSGSILASAMVLGIFVLATSNSFAQSIGDIARQQRERLGAERRAAAHVYTNEDLAEPHIVAASQQQSAAPAQTLALPAPVSAMDVFAHQMTDREEHHAS